MTASGCAYSNEKNPIEADIGVLIILPGNSFALEEGAAS